MHELSASPKLLKLMSLHFWISTNNSATKFDSNESNIWFENTMHFQLTTCVDVVPTFEISFSLRQIHEIYFQTPFNHSNYLLHGNVFICWAWAFLWTMEMFCTRKKKKKLKFDCIDYAFVSILCPACCRLSVVPLQENRSFNFAAKWRRPQKTWYIRKQCDTVTPYARTPCRRLANGHMDMAWHYVCI